MGNEKSECKNEKKEKKEDARVRGEWRREVEWSVRRET